MTPEQRESFRKQFGHFTRAELEHRIAKGDTGMDVSHMRLWLGVLADEEREAATQRAREALEIARKAAEASSRSARFAMYAAIISLVAILVRMFFG